MRTLSDEDIKALAVAIHEQAGHNCRFSNIKQEDLDEAVKFYKNWNRVMCESKTSVRKTLINIVICGGSGLLVLGFYSAIKDHLAKLVP